jgi:hypothetical protein
MSVAARASGTALSTSAPTKVDAMIISGRRRGSRTSLPCATIPAEPLPSPRDRHGFRLAAASRWHAPRMNSSLERSCSRVGGTRDTSRQFDPGRTIMFGFNAQRGAGKRGKKSQGGRSKPAGDGVVDADNRIVFAVMAVGMLVGALLTTPSKPTDHAQLKSPTSNARVAAAAR